MTDRRRRQVLAQIARERAERFESSELCPARINELAAPCRKSFVDKLGHVVKTSNCFITQPAGSPDA